MDIRKKLSIKSNDFIILLSGRLVKEKGILELIRDVKRLKDLDNVKLLIVRSSWHGSNKESEFVKK